MKFKIGDKVKLVSRRYADADANPRWGGSQGNIAGVILRVDIFPLGYTVNWQNGRNNSNYSDQDLELIEPEFMRRTIDKGAEVKVMTKPEVFFDLDDKVKELGGTKKWTGKYVPKIGETGDVLGTSEGYVLVDFEAGEALLDMSCLEPQKRKEEVQFLVKYPNGTLEEYSSEKEVEKRMQELYKAQSLKPGEVIKVYNVEGYREVKIKIEIAFT